MNKSDIALFEGLKGQTFLNGYNYDDDYCCVLMTTTFDRPRLYGYVITGRALPSEGQAVLDKLHSFGAAWHYPMSFYEQVDGKTCLGFKTDYYSHYVDPDVTLAPVVIFAMTEYASMVSALTWHFANYIRLVYPVPSDDPKKQYITPLTWQDTFAMQKTIVEAMKPYCTMEIPND